MAMDSLSIMMGLGKKSPLNPQEMRTLPQDAALDDMISEQDVFDAQDAQGAESRAQSMRGRMGQTDALGQPIYGAPYATSSREDIRKGARANLRQALEPARRQEQGLNARAAAAHESALMQFLTGQQMQQERQAQQQQYMLERQAQNADRTDARANDTQAAQMARLQATQKAADARAVRGKSLERAKMLETQAQKAGGPWQSIKSMFGYENEPQRLQKEAAAARAAAEGDIAGDVDLEELVNTLGLSGEQAAALGKMLGG